MGAKKQPQKSKKTAPAEAQENQPIAAADEARDRERESASVDEESVSDNRFEQMVSETLDTVGGKMLFKMRIDGESGGEHVAAAAVGEGDDQHFLILSMPLEGGELQVEEAAESANPLAKIAASYAGIAQKLDDAA